MIKRFFNTQKICGVLLISILIQSCALLGGRAPAVLPTVQDIETASDGLLKQAAPTATVSSQSMPGSAATEVNVTQTPVSTVTITALKGNIFIRRGPGVAYNPVAVLYKDQSTKAVARDVLSKWVQVVIPDSDKLGWVSLQTAYSKLDGEMSSLPDLATTDWPVPAYLRNCTHHDMYVMPGEVTLPSLYAYPDNEVWLYPGHYTVQDLFVPGEPQVLSFDIREGVQIDIKRDGLGEHRKC
jgi:hypothetical protein